MSVVGVLGTVASVGIGAAGLAMSGSSGGGGKAKIPWEVQAALDKLLQNSDNELAWFKKTYKNQWVPAQQKAMALADTVSQQQLGLAGRASDMGAAAWEKGLDLWGQWGKDFAPVTSQVAQDAMGWDSAANLGLVAGEAAADVKRSAGLARRNLEDQVFRAGGSPTGGRALGLLARTGIDEAGAAAAAMNAAREGRRMQGAGLRQQAAGLGLNVLGAGNQMAGLGGNLNAQAGGLARGAQESRALGDEYILKGAGLKRMGWQDANAGLSAAVGGLNQSQSVANQGQALQNQQQAEQLAGFGRLAGYGLSRLPMGKGAGADLSGTGNPDDAVWEPRLGDVYSG